MLWRVPPPDGENLVVDGSFESGGTGSWFSDRALSFTLDQNLQQRTGSYNAACWHPTENSGDCSIVQHVAVPETGTYLVTIYAKADRPGAWVGANLIAQSGETQPFANRSRIDRITGVQTLFILTSNTRPKCPQRRETLSRCGVTHQTPRGGWSWMMSA